MLISATVSFPVLALYITAPAKSLHLLELKIENLRSLTSRWFTEAASPWICQVNQALEQSGSRQNWTSGQHHCHGNSLVRTDWRKASAAPHSSLLPTSQVPPKLLNK